MRLIMRRPLVRLGLTAGLLVAIASPRFHAAQADEAKVFATVLGPNGNPVAHLTAADFVIHENGEEKRVLNADISTEPLAVELITDRLGGRSDFTPEQMRAGLDAIVETILSVSPDSQIGLRTFDSESVQQVKPTVSAVQLSATIKKLFSNNGNSVLLEAIADAGNALRFAKTPRRAIIGLIAGYKGDASGITSLQSAEALRQSGASFWAVEAVANGVMNPSRDVMLTQATRDSGGYHSRVQVGTAVANACTRMAVLVLSQYAVTYGAPASGKNKRIDVAVKGQGMTVAAAHWAADR